MNATGARLLRQPRNSVVFFVCVLPSAAKLDPTLITLNTPGSLLELHPRALSSGVHVILHQQHPKATVFKLANRWAAEKWGHEREHLDHFFSLTAPSSSSSPAWGFVRDRQEWCRNTHEDLVAHRDHQNGRFRVTFSPEGLADECAILALSFLASRPEVDYVEGVFITKTPQNNLYSTMNI